jgi:outer membrane protein TolC
VLIIPRLRIQRSILAAALTLLAGCKAAPSAPPNSVGLPIPPGLEQGIRISAATSRPTGNKYLSPGQKQLDLTPMKVIHLTFELCPRIRAAYLRYMGEKARYDYIMANWTSTTPGALIGPGWNRTQDAADTISNEQTQRVEAFVERNFLDTSRFRAFAGALNEDAGESHGFHPTAGGLLQYPLWVSREALQRSSEQIFQQTRVNDAQLEYVKQVRENLGNLTSTFFGVLGIYQRVGIRQHQIDDLHEIQRRAEGAGKPATDLQRIQAEEVTATTALRDQQSNYEIEMAWMTSTMGLPRGLDVRLVDEPFDPFGQTPQEEMLAMSLQTDPEIATLKNAIRDAEVQLALARKGKVDVTMSLGASTDLAGSGSRSGQAEYRAEALLTVAFIDARLSNSLAREAGANIRQYEQAIQRRRNNVYVEANEPLIKIRMLGKNIPDRQRNVERYQRDYEAAVRDYVAGRMDIDNLLQRRTGLLNEELELSYNKGELGGRISSLATTTGKFFELLQQEADGKGSSASQPASTRAASTSPSVDAMQSERSQLMREILP